VYSPSPPSVCAPSQLAILIFVENQMAVILVNKPEHKLKKAVGYHYDLVLVALLNGVSGVMGMPWTCAASVRSIQHVQAMSVFQAHNAPGERPKLLSVYEQRLTNVAVHMLICKSDSSCPVLVCGCGYFLHCLYACTCVYLAPRKFGAIR
jgi:hypothetical protein